MLWLASSYYSRKKMAFHATLQEAQLLNPPGLRLGGYNKEKRSLKIEKKNAQKPKPLRIHYDMNTVTVSSVSSCQEGLWTVHLFTFLQSCITLVTYHCITRVPRPRPHLVIFGDRIIFARMRLRVSQIQMSSSVFNANVWLCWTSRPLHHQQSSSANKIRIANCSTIPNLSSVLSCIKIGIGRQSI
jgi:hypothetical protein